MPGRETRDEELEICTKNGTLKTVDEAIRSIKVVFYATSVDREPVRDWLRSLRKAEKRSIGEDIKTVQFGWPVGMPLVKKLDRDLWEVRTTLVGTIARVIFVFHKEQIVLLHGFIKKTAKIPLSDLELAHARLRAIKKGEHHEK